MVRGRITIGGANRYPIHPVAASSWPWLPVMGHPAAARRASSVSKRCLTVRAFRDRQLIGRHLVAATARIFVDQSETLGEVDVFGTGPSPVVARRKAGGPLNAHGHHRHHAYSRDYLSGAERSL
jgi:hypothetical protein